MLHADRFLNDSRVRDAKRILIEAAREHSAAIRDLRPPDAALSESFQRQLDAAAQARGRPLILPYLGSGIGHGAFVELADGSVKLDFISGIGVHILGHSHPRILEAALDAALSDTVMQGNLQMNPDSLEASRLLLELANRRGAQLAHCFLSTSGAMANENALKILFQKRHPADRILAFRGAFAGRSIATSQITDRPEYREGIPPVIDVDYIPFFDPARAEESTRETLAALEGHLAAHPGRHAAMIFELILGEGGFYPGGPDFFARLMTRLREAGVPVFLDEIQSFGRTGEPFAFQFFGLDRFADVVTVGKMTQVCATLYRAEFNPKPALLSQTFTGSTSSIRACLAVLTELRDGDYFGEHGKILRLGRHFARRLEELAARHPGLLRGPFGMGGMIGLTPLDGETNTASEFVKRLFEAGVLSFPAGKTPARVRFLPPYGAIDERTIDLACPIIEATLLSFQ